MDQDTIAAYEKLLEDFANLEKSLPRSRKTIMDVSGYPHYENVASNILAFFLDSTEEHGFGDLWTRSLIECALGAAAESPGETCSVERERATTLGRRLDILYSTPVYTVGIENKIFAGLYNDLADYGSLIDGEALEQGTLSVKIVLSVYEEAMREDFVNVTYTNLFAAVRSHIGTYLEGADNTWVAFMRDFIHTIERHRSGGNMERAADQLLKEHYAESSNLFGRLCDWKKEAKGRARSILERVKLPDDIEYCQESFVYQESGGFYTCICVEIQPPESHRLTLSKSSSHLTVEVYLSGSGWGAWLWSRNNRGDGKAIITELLDAVGISHDAENVVATRPWDATDEQVIELINEGIAAARQIL